MTDWNPQIVKIEKVEKHPNADTLSIYTVLGDYPIVDKTGKYNVDDLATYIPIDSIVPDTEKYYFLCPKMYEKYEEDGEFKQRMVGFKYPVGSVPEKNRIIKAKKILNIYSQGLLDLPIPNLCLGDSVVEAIGLKKWEEEVEENLPNVKKTKGANAAPAPKGWAIPYYDIEGVRKYLNCLIPNEEIVLTEKINGSNASFVHDGTSLWVKSRNFYKKQNSDDMWWDIAYRYDLEKKLSLFPMMVFFGEIVGQVKGFRYDAKIENGQLATVIYFFDIFDLTKSRYLDYDDRIQIIQQIGLKATPELYRGPWRGKEHAYTYAEGPSTLNPKHVREGWVLNTIKERFEKKLNSRMQVKLIGEGYNLIK